MLYENESTQLPDWDDDLPALPEEEIEYSPDDIGDDLTLPIHPYTDD